MSEKLPTSSSETKDDDSSSSESGVSKKKSSAVSTLGGLTAERFIKPDTAKQPEPSTESLWERMDRIATEFKKDLKGDKPEPAADISEGVPETPANEVAAETPDDAGEVLAPAEALETVQLYSDGRMAALQQELLDSAADDEFRAETAANMAFLRSVSQRLSAENASDVGEVLDAAEREIIAPFDEVTAEMGSLADSQEYPAAAMTEAAEVAHNDAPEVPGQRQPMHDTEPSATMPLPEVMFPATGGGGEKPPYTYDKFYGGGDPGGEGMDTGSASGFPAEAAGAGMITTAAALGRERTAMGQGVVAGGIAGYLIGKRRGRKKAETKSGSLQAKLEKQVAGLQRTVAEKEQKIRSQAAEYTRAAGIVPIAVKERAPAALKPERVVHKTAAVEKRPAPRTLERAPVRQAVQPERLGRFVVEAPAAAVFGVAAAEKVPVARRIDVKPSPAAAILKGRNVEQLSASELNQAAEKVKIQGVTLKELQDSRRLDERGVRRVMAEYLRGGNVGEVLSRELMEKELQYERDPRMKTAAASMATGGGGLAVAAALFGDAGISAKDAPGTGADDKSRRSEPAAKPIPDPARLDALRRQQALTLAGGTGLLLLALLMLVLLIG